MTVQEALTLARRLTPNQYSDDDLRRWLMLCEENIFDSIVLTHDGHMCVPKPTGEDCSELIAPDLFAEDIYINFIQARIAKENLENVKYNQAISLYNDGYLKFAKWYNERHAPRPRRVWWRF